MMFGKLSVSRLFLLILALSSCSRIGLVDNVSFHEVVDRRTFYVNIIIVLEGVLIDTPGGYAMKSADPVEFCAFDGDNNYANTLLFIRFGREVTKLRISESIGKRISVEGLLKKRLHPDIPSETFRNYDPEFSIGPIVNARILSIGDTMDLCSL